MQFSGIPCLVVLVIINVPEERITSIIRISRIGELGTTLELTSNIPDDGILHSHRREILKSYIALTGWAL
jgi:hypothetical protein